MHPFPVQSSSSLIDLKTVISVGIPALVAVLGWFFGHLLNSRRELANRKREARIKALERAYIRLAYASNREFTPKVIEDIETFVAELQLYGKPTHVELMKTMVNQFLNPPASKKVDFDPLLESLRDSLREELGLEPIKGSVWWLRIGQPKPPAAPLSTATAPESAVM